MADLLLLRSNGRRCTARLMMGRVSVGKIGMRRLGIGGALVLATALSPACARVPDEPLGRSADAVLTTYRIRLPKTVVLGAFAAAAEGTLTVGDRALVVDNAGLPTLVSNAGTGKVTLG